MKKQGPTVFSLKKLTSHVKDIYRLKVKGWKMIYQTNGIQKQIELAILKSDKADFKPKLEEIRR
jgi:hypothetical protein